MIALVGDGAMQMNGLNELITIAKYRDRWSDQRLIVLVLNNHDLNQVTWEQRAMEGNPKFDGSQELPDFPYARYAELIGLEGIRVDAPDQVGPAWDRALAARRPVVIEAITDPDVPPLPPHITIDQARALSSALLSGDPERRADHQGDLQAEGRRTVRGPMSSITAPATTPVGELEVDAFTVPTDAAEADGTLRWDATTIVVVQAHAGGEIGLGYTYADLATATLIRSKLAAVVQGSDAMAPQAAWRSMVRETRNLGRPGITSMAIAAVDTALWDLKARLLGLPLSTLLGAVRDRVPVYGSGGFTAYSLSRLCEQLAGWVQRGIPRVKMKVGSSPGDDPARVRAAREAIGPEARAVRRRQRRVLAQAGAGVGAPVSRGSGRRLVRRARQLGRPGGPAADARPCARRGWRSPPASTAMSCRTSSGCSTTALSTCSRQT